MENVTMGMIFNVIHINIILYMWKNKCLSASCISFVIDQFTSFYISSVLQEVMKMEAARSSETLVSCHITTRRHNPNDLHFK